MVEPTTLQIVWFLLFTFLIAGYAVLDGFDLGVGILHLFAKNDEERRIGINAIGPVWDGNEVWLVTGGGALFAAFPIVYATVFSGFYLALMLVLAALIARAVSMEFRGKVDGARWRRVWDLSFGIGSLLAVLLFGVAMGNILRGIPINDKYVYVGTFLGLLNPYALLIGVLSVVMMVMHGAAYLSMKSEGELRERMLRWVTPAWMVFVVLFFVATIATYFVAPFLFEGKLGSPFFWVFLVLIAAGVAYVPVAAKAGQSGRLFGATSAIVLSTVALSGVGLFPRLVPSLLNLENSLTIMNASAYPATLQAMLIIALIGMPLVLAYTFFVYRVFKGKVVLHEDSY